MFFTKFFHIYRTYITKRNTKLSTRTTHTHTTHVMWLYKMVLQWPKPCQSCQAKYVHMYSQLAKNVNHHCTFPMCPEHPSRLGGIIQTNSFSKQRTVDSIMSSTLFCATTTKQTWAGGTPRSYYYRGNNKHTQHSPHI